MKSIGVRPYLHVRTASNPIYDLGGEGITFITNYSGLPQVWQVKKGDGWPTQVSFTDERIMFVQHIKETDRYIVGMDEGVNERTQLYILEEGELIALTDSPEHIHRYGGHSTDGKWIAWASNRRENAYFDVSVQQIETKEIREVFRGDGTYGAVVWHPNGESLVIQKTNSNLDNDLGLLDLASGEVQWLTHHNGEASFQAVKFNEDGTNLYMLSNLEREYYSLAKLNVTTSKIEWLDERVWDLDGLTISADKKTLAYTVNEGGISKGIIYHLSTGNVEELPSFGGVMSELTFSPDHRHLAFVLNGATSPADIWEYNLEKKQVTRLTHVSYSPAVEKRLVEPELIHFPSFDGKKIPAFYYKPDQTKDEKSQTNSPGKYPVVVFVHGGPESQIKSVYNPFLQYFLNRGYAVCTPNVRGSTGYGKSYTHLDDARKRMDAIKDLAYLTDWLKTDGNADPDKIAIMGRSYGGFAVLAAITHYPQLWNAAIDIVGISSFRSFLENTSIWRRKQRESEYGSIEKDGDFFDEIDPIHHTNKITAPLLVLHGANDPRVPIEETEQIVNDLKKRNHPVDYIRFEDEGHFFVKLKNNITAYSAVADFLDNTFRS